MAEPMKFDAYRMDFSTGITLVEASAGTGKTFTIAMIVLRAVVELGLRIDQVLVVTFTTSATDELRSRVRQRLSQARTCLRNPDRCRGAAGDAAFEAWLEGIDNPEQALRRLDLALLDIDAAPIHTIHGFSQKILHDLALESGQPFDLELTGDVSIVKKQVVQDYWRSRMYQWDKRYCSLVIPVFDSPEKLHRSVAGAEDVLSVLVPDSITLDSACNGFDPQREDLLAWWSRYGGSLGTAVSEAVAGGFFTAKSALLVTDSLERIDASFRRDCSPLPADLGWLQRDTLVTMLHGVKLRGDEKKHQFIADWPLPGNTLDRYLTAVEDLLLAVRLECATALRTDVVRRMRERGRMSFDDLIIGLARAVDGPSGRELCRQVRRRYRMALIDEFQDTDSAQWQSFSTLFAAKDHYLYLIGDPKQAIYRFRGADIFTYFTARGRADRKCTLRANYRSNPGLVSAVNDLFQTFSMGGVRYQPVLPARSAADGRLIAHGNELPGLVYCQLDKKEPDDPAWNVEDSGELIRGWVVSETVRLISAGSPVHRESIDAAGQQQSNRLAAEDIAILVRTHREAEAYQSSFRQIGVPAVITSKTGIFTTDECGSMLRVLQAVAAPGDERLLRTAMSCDWFGLSGNEHFRICNDPAEFSSWHERFQEYTEVWQQAGFLSMIRKLLETEEVEILLGRNIGAERRLCNIQHLAELIQDAERQGHMNMSQTLQWLQEMSGGKQQQDETELRLESDAGSLRIITMHSAKGLEFPVVFCPSLLTPSYHRKDTPLVHCHLDDGTRICDLGSRQFDRNRQRSLLEEEQETMRLAYVAVTRAQLRCYVIWAEIKQHNQRPASFAASLGQLLFPGGAVGFEDQKRELEKRGREDNCDYRLIGNRIVDTPYQAAARPAGAKLEARKSSGRTLITYRTRTSFSGLAMLSSRDNRDGLPGAFDETGAPIVTDSAPETAAGRDEAVDSRLPGGIRFGNIVHETLERMSFSDLAAGGCDRDVLATICRRYNIRVDHEPLQALLAATVATKLLADSPKSFCLADLAEDCLIKEMEFTLHLEASSTQVINDLLADDPSVSSLAVKRIEGFLTGYIDLLCRINGKYYVVDYKTNHLGDTAASYQRRSLQAAMQAHNYGLQYWLYTLVVHRHLQRWLPDYRYGEHFGGVLYLFVRGMRPEYPGKSVFFTLPDERLVQELDNRFGAR